MFSRSYFYFRYIVFYLSTWPPLFQIWPSTCIVRRTFHSTRLDSCWSVLLIVKRKAQWFLTKMSLYTQLHGSPFLATTFPPKNRRWAPIICAKFSRDETKKPGDNIHSSPSCAQWHSDWTRVSLSPARISKKTKYKCNVNIFSKYGVWGLQPAAGPIDL